MTPKWESWLCWYFTMSLQHQSRDIIRQLFHNFFYMHINLEKYRYNVFNGNTYGDFLVLDQTTGSAIQRAMLPAWLKYWTQKTWRGQKHHRWFSSTYSHQLRHIWLLLQIASVERAYLSARAIFGVLVLWHDEKVSDQTSKCPKGPTTPCQWWVRHRTLYLFGLYCRELPTRSSRSSIPLSSELLSSW